MGLLQCGPRKYPYYTGGQIWKFQGERGASVAKVFKGKYQVYLEFGTPTPLGACKGGGVGRVRCLALKICTCYSLIDHMTGLRAGA